MGEPTSVAAVDPGWAGASTEPIYTPDPMPNLGFVSPNAAIGLAMTEVGAIDARLAG